MDTETGTEMVCTNRSYDLRLRVNRSSLVVCGGLMLAQWEGPGTQYLLGKASRAVTSGSASVLVLVLASLLVLGSASVSPSVVP